MKMDTDETPKQRSVLSPCPSFSFCISFRSPVFLWYLLSRCAFLYGFAQKCVSSVDGKPEFFIRAQLPAYAGAVSSQYEEWKRVCAEYLLQDFADGDGAQKCTSVIRKRHQLQSKRFIRARKKDHASRLRNTVVSNSIALQTR